MIHPEAGLGHLVREVGQVSFDRIDVDRKHLGVWLVTAGEVQEHLHLVEAGVVGLAVGGQGVAITHQGHWLVADRHLVLPSALRQDHRQVDGPVVQHSHQAAADLYIEGVVGRQGQPIGQGVEEEEQVGGLGTELELQAVPPLGMPAQGAGEK